MNVFVDCATLKTCQRNVFMHGFLSRYHNTKHFSVDFNVKTNFFSFKYYIAIKICKKNLIVKIVKYFPQTLRNGTVSNIELFF